MTPDGLRLDSPPLDVYGQMALDELLLDRGVEAPLLRLFRWKDAAPSATFGYFQPVAEARAVLSERGLAGAPLARRPTGGGVVLHDGDLTFSLLLPWPPATSPQALYKDIHRAAHLALKALGVPTRLWSPKVKTQVVHAACFPAPVPIDLVAEDGEKLLGGAFRKRRGVGLYQGSFRIHGLGRPRAELEDALAAGLLGPAPRRGSADPGLLAAAALLARERYATREWNERR